MVIVIVPVFITSLLYAICPAKSFTYIKSFYCSKSLMGGASIVQAVTHLFCAWPYLSTWDSTFA